MTAPEETGGVLPAGVPLDLPGYPEPVTTTIQKQGKAAGRECRVILLGTETGMYYCAHDGCDYTHAQWSSVFAHRSKHAKDANPGPLDQVAYAESLQSQLETALWENANLKAQLAAAMKRADRLFKKLREKAAA